MKRNISFIVLGLALVLLVGGSYLLYNKLSKEYNTGSNLVIDEPQKTSKPDNGSDKDDNTASTDDNSTENNQSDTNTNTDGYNDYFNFTVTDWDGNEVELKDFKGKPVILNFWASWCPPCKGEMPDFEDAYKEHGDKIQFMMINLTDGNRETVELAKKHITDNDYSFPVFFDTKAEVGYSFSVSSIPATYLVDENGNVVGHAIGAIDRKTLDEAIKILLE